MSRTHRRVARLIRFYHMLRSRASTRQLSAYQFEFNISRRTLFRDLKTLRMAGCLISFEGKNGMYYVNNEIDSPVESMSIEDLGKLIDVLRVTSTPHVSNLVVSENAERLLRQIERYLEGLHVNIRTAVQDAEERTVRERLADQITRERDSTARRTARASGNGPTPHAS